VRILRIVVSGVVEVVADTGRDEYSHILDGQPVDQTTHVYEAVHHLGDAETVAEVVERIVAVVLLYAQLDKQAPSGDLLCKFHSAFRDMYTVAKK